MQRDRSPKRKAVKPLTLCFWRTYFVLELGLSRSIVDCCYENLNQTDFEEQTLRYISETIVQPTLTKYLISASAGRRRTGGFFYELASNFVDIFIGENQIDGFERYSIWQFHWGFTKGVLNFGMWGHRWLTGGGNGWFSFWHETLNCVCAWLESINRFLARLPPHWDKDHLIWSDDANNPEPHIVCSYCNEKIKFKPDVIIVEDRLSSAYCHRAMKQDGNIVYFGSGKTFFDSDEYVTHLLSQLVAH